MHDMNFPLCLSLCHCHNLPDIILFISTDIYVYILMEKSYCALYKLTGQVTGTHPRVEIASGQSLGHVLLFGPTPTHDSPSFYSVEKHILSNFNVVIVMPRLAEQPPDFNRLISSMRRRCQACVNIGGSRIL